MGILFLLLVMEAVSFESVFFTFHHLWCSRIARARVDSKHALASETSAASIFRREKQFISTSH